MKTQYLRAKSLFLISAILGMVLIACHKEEFMPPEIGDKIPYNDTLTETYREILLKSSYTLFAEAWTRSKIDSILLVRGGATAYYTLLVPTDQAMIEAGWTSATISSTSIVNLNNFLMPYVFSTRIDKDQVQNSTIGFRARSVYRYTNLNYTQKDSIYYFQAIFGWENSKLVVNGKSMGTDEPIAATNGFIWPIKNILQRPTVTAWDVLKNDPRFSMYVALVSYTDELYKTIFTTANGHTPASGHAGEQVYNRNSPRFYDLDNHPGITSSTPYANTLNTWFIPTNEAFAQAGFNNLDDLIDFNEKRGLPTAEWYVPPSSTGQTAFYRINGEFATDTLLDYHVNWGMRLDGYDFTRERNASLFFSSDLRQDLLYKYPISTYTEITYGYFYPLIGTTRYHFMPFNFSNSGQLSVIGHPDSSVDFIETDIYTLNGVIHVVNRLIIPDKMKF